MESQLETKQMILSISEPLKENDLCSLVNVSNLTQVCLVGDGNPCIDWSRLLDILSNNSKLQILRIQKYAINDTLLARFITMMETYLHITSLDLSNNCLSDSGATLLSTYISNNSCLKTLSILNNNINEDGAIAIGKAVANNETLSQLKLDRDLYLRLVAWHACLGVNTSRKPIILDPSDTTNENVSAILDQWQACISKGNRLPTFTRHEFDESQLQENSCKRTKIEASDCEEETCETKST